MIRVAIADDHAVVRHGLAQLLSTFVEVELVGEAEDGEGAVALCDRERPDVVLMDLEMPEVDGIEATRRIKAEQPDIDVFFAVEDDGVRPEALAAMAELRRVGRAADTDYAGRSLKGQLTQAGRLGAAATVIVRADGATVRRAGAKDEEFPSLAEAVQSL